MTEKTVSSGNDEEQEPAVMTDWVSGSLFELGWLEGYIIECDEIENPVCPALTLLMLRALKKKIRYYEKKYNFQIPEDDNFLIEDLFDFFKASEKLESEHGCNL